MNRIIVPGSYWNEPKRRWVCHSLTFTSHWHAVIHTTSKMLGTLTRWLLFWPAFSARPRTCCLDDTVVWSSRGLQSSKRGGCSRWKARRRQINNDGSQSLCVLPVPCSTPHAHSHEPYAPRSSLSAPSHTHLHSGLCRLHVYSPSQWPFTATTAGA